MKLNHLNLAVQNVEEAREFFSRHFGFQCLHQQPQKIAVMGDNNGFVLALSNFSGQSPTYPPEHHIGFHLQSVQAVNDTYTRLQSEGVNLGRTPHSHHGSHVFYFTPLSNITIEVGCLLPQT